MMRSLSRRRLPIRACPAALAVLIAALAAGCQGRVRPDWVDQPGLARPAAQYLTAVGAGASRAEAADAAVARLAQRIAVDVEARETARSTYVADDDGASASRRQRVQLDRRIDLGTGVHLMGTEVVETWQAPEGDVFALAVLDRLVAASAYDDLLRSLSGQVRAELAAAEASAPGWSRYVHLGRALALAEEHDELLRLRSVIAPGPGPGGRGALAPPIAAARRAAAGELVAVVEPAAGTPGTFAPIVRDALLAAGIAVRPQAPAAVRARVSYEASPRPFAQRQDHVVAWRLTVRFVDGNSGRAVDGLTLDGDGWGLTAAAASATAVHRAGEHLRRALAPYLHDLMARPGAAPPVAVGGTAEVG